LAAAVSTLTSAEALFGKEGAMFRHSHYLEIPWDVHWDEKESGSQHHLLLMLILIFMVMFLIRVGVTSGLA
jgi:hypothetical protein